MAVEAKRGCGYRKVGGLYLVSGRMSAPCCKFPIPLSVCPCCGGGIKQTRGFTWVNPAQLIGPAACVAAGGPRSLETFLCPAADPARFGERAGLLWIGAGFYKTADEFSAEAAALGVSRRITAVPRDFVVGKTWILLAHPKAVTTDEGPKPGIFRAFLPERIELIVKQSELDAVADDMASHAAAEPTVGWGSREACEADKSPLLKRFERDRARGVTWVGVPDDDPDHQGTVYDQPDDEPEQLPVAS